MTLPKSKPDRRVTRTQKLLRDALHSLIHERDYDSIAVKEILDRANVGRSAFYAHFRDKDELLVSALHEILRTVPSAHPKLGDRNERLLWFSLPVFEHLDQLRRVGELRLGPRGRSVLHEHLQKVLVELVAEDVRKRLQGRGKVASQIPPNLLTHHIASTFILVLNWWVESKSLLSSKEVNDLFGSLILPALIAASEDNRRAAV